jgi:hypothetical protein
MYELSAFLFFLGPMMVIIILYVRMGVTIRSRMIKFPGETKHLDSRTKPIIRMLGKTGKELARKEMSCLFSFHPHSNKIHCLNSKNCEVF